MKTLLQTLFFFLLATQICFTQWENHEQTTDNNYTINYFSDNLVTDSLWLDSVIINYKKSQNVPGIATMIIKDNQIIWSKNYGYRNIKLQLPVEDSTYFLMGSISKTIVATAIMQLWENGKIDLNRNVNIYLPGGFRIFNPRFPFDSITVRMLMTHTSSIQDNWDQMIKLWGCGDFPETYKSFLTKYFTIGEAYHSLNNFYSYHPGQDWNYSNAAMCLLALVVEHMSGKSFQEYTRDSIFIPLEMKGSSWFLSSLDTNHIALPYMYKPPTPMCHTGFTFWPIGQLRTNKLELSNFLSAFLNGGVLNNKRILKTSTINYMLSSQTNFTTYYNGPQGLVWYSFPFIFDDTWGHDGEWYGANTFMVCHPEEKWGLIFFINWATPPDYTSNRPLSQMALYAHNYSLVSVESDGKNIASDFTLNQNYPNPFNPTTKIKYGVPLSPPLLKGEIPIHRDGEFVTLKVYDILGNEVFTLVNEEKSPGNYEVEFNAEKLSSGVYFYQLKAGDFANTKKMILLR